MIVVRIFNGNQEVEDLIRGALEAEGLAVAEPRREVFLHFVPGNAMLIVTSLDVQPLVDSPLGRRLHRVALAEALTSVAPQIVALAPRVLIRLVRGHRRRDLDPSVLEQSLGDRRVVLDFTLR